MSESFKEIAEKNNKRYAKTKKYVDWAYLVAVAFIVAGRAMVLTRESNDTFVTVIVYTGSALLFLIGAYRLFFQFFKNWKKALLGLAVVIFSFIFSELSSSASEFPVVALAIVGAMDVSADSILLAGIAGNLIMIANNVIMNFFGKAADNLNLMGNNSFFYLGENRFTFSIFNNLSSTDFASHYFWILTAYLWVRGKKITVGELFAVAALDFLIYSLTGSSTTFICITLILICAICYKLYQKYSTSKLKTRLSDKFSIIRKLASGLNSIFVFCSKYSFVIFAFLTISLAVSYNIGNPVLSRLNDMLHMRISLGNRGIEEFGIHLFSTNVHIYGAYSSIDNFYNFMDTSYISILVRSGVIPLIFFVGTMTVIQIRHKKYIYGVILIAVCALSCVEEHHLVQLPYNFFILLLFADYTDDKLSSDKENKTLLSNRMVNVFASVLCIVFTISIFVVNIPRFNAVKELDRLDSKSDEIYLAIQNNIDNSYNEGRWQQEVKAINSSFYGKAMDKPCDFVDVTGSEWSQMIEDSKAHAYYSVYYDDQCNFASDDRLITIMINDDVKSLIGNGSVVIEYDVQTGKVYSVWYSEQYGCQVIDGGRTANRNDRLIPGTIKEGYSTGD